jgi:glycosyltransferase involved in cell wall biosynthesis
MISVIIPVFNSFKFLEKSIQSVIPFSVIGEIILIEDGSSDSSLELCFMLQKVDARIIIYTHPFGENKGAAESRNLGIKKALFPYIAFLDSDDTYFENRFSEALSILNLNPEVDGCYGKVRINYVDQDQQKLMGPPNSLPSSKLFTFLLNGGYFHTNSITVRKSFLERVGGFNQICWPHEDVDLWIRMAYNGKLISIPSEVPLAEYKVHGNNLSKSASWRSKWILWSVVFRNFFFKNINWLDRFYILKQLSKVILLIFK